MKRYAILFGLFVVLMVGISFGVSFAYNSWIVSKPTQEGKRQELTELLRSGVLAEALLDNKPDRTLLESGLLGTDFTATITPYVRVIQADVAGVFTEAGIRAQLEAAARADLGLGESDPLPDNAQKQIDDYISNNLRPDGTLLLNIGQVMAQAILTQNAVISSIQLVDILRQLDTGDEEKVSFKITVLPNTDLEDSWKDEVVFEGTAKEMVDSKAVYLDFENGIAVFRRPANKLLPEPKGYPYVMGDSRQIRNQDSVVYVRNIGGLPAAAKGEVLRLSNDGFVLISGTFASFDLGSPVFYVQDGKPYLVGILVDISQDGNDGVVVLFAKLQKRISAIAP